MHLRDEDLLLLMGRGVHVGVHSTIAMEVGRVLSRLSIKTALQKFIILLTGHTRCVKELFGRVKAQVSLVDWAQPPFTRMSCSTNFGVNGQTFSR